MTTVPPASILSRDLPEDPKVDNYELGVAIAKVVGRGGLLGAQRIGALWRVYLNTSEARANLLRQGLAVRGIMVAVASQNLILVKGPDGILIPGTRLTVSDIPLSIANATIEAALIKKGVKTPFCPKTGRNQGSRRKAHRMVIWTKICLHQSSKNSIRKNYGYWPL